MGEDIYTLIARRATCRSFKEDPVDDAVLDRLLAAGCKSPSSCGFQSISIIKVTDKEKRKKLASFSRGQKFIATAPVSLVFCIDYHRMDQVLRREPAPLPNPGQLKCLWMGIADAVICAQTIVLAAEAEGLGSCYNGNVLNVLDQLSELLALPSHVCPAIMLALGWPRSTKRQPPKYPPELLVHENEYRELPDDQVYSAYRRQNGYQKLKPRPQWVEACCEKGRQLHGEEYARQIREDIEKKDYLGSYQYWLGCYYTEEPDFLNFAGYRNYFKKQGFTWLEGEETEQ
ncbi:MAG: nitroreductase family protein [Clostridiales bacterium]|nr:nitroreductase family protein [Clostridiales bacterium]